MSGPAEWATILSDAQRGELRRLGREANHLEATVRAFAIRAYEALQPYMEARSLPAVEDEDRFYEWAGVEPLLNTLDRIAGHATAASLQYPRGPVEWFDLEAFKAKETGLRF